eukprot:6207203-Pleurochrysis_carterae.AAC.1
MAQVWSYILYFECKSSKLDELDYTSLPQSLIGSFILRKNFGGPGAYSLTFVTVHGESEPTHSPTGDSSAMKASHL